MNTLPNAYQSRILFGTESNAKVKEKTATVIKKTPVSTINMAKKLVGIGIEGKEPNFQKKAAIMMDKENNKPFSRRRPDAGATPMSRKAATPAFFTSKAPQSASVMRTEGFRQRQEEAKAAIVAASIAEKKSSMQRSSTPTCASQAQSRPVPLSTRPVSSRSRSSSSNGRVRPNASSNASSNASRSRSTSRSRSCSQEVESESSEVPSEIGNNPKGWERHLERHQHGRQNKEHGRENGWVASFDLSAGVKTPRDLSYQPTRKIKKENPVNAKQRSVDATERMVAVEERMDPYSNVGKNGKVQYRSAAEKDISTKATTASSLQRKGGSSYTSTHHIVGSFESLMQHYEEGLGEEMDYPLESVSPGPKVATGEPSEYHPDSASNLFLL